jgi:hypothetical protein
MRPASRFQFWGARATQAGVGYSGEPRVVRDGNFFRVTGNAAGKVVAEVKAPSFWSASSDFDRDTVEITVESAR